VTIVSGQATNAPDIQLQPHVAEVLPHPLASAIELELTDAYTATTNFPPDAAASVHAYQFEFNGEPVDTLRLYLPLDLASGEELPLLFMIYPTHTDGWQSVSVAFAASGYAMVAISPIAQRVMDIDAHAQDARVAFTLARTGALSPHIAPGKAVALGGSFSSAILHRFLRDESDHVAAWITVGGISNAFSGTADYYAGNIEMPPQYELAIPALGPPNIYPLPFLRYSPVYTAHDLPPTMVIHTSVDRITPIDQAYQLEEALRSAGIPVDVFYYEDVSHYLQIGEDITEAGVEMFYRILDYVEQNLTQE
jgi:dipeptidyl aminopeptidase/acylaminoacyl peptidase